MMELKFKFDFDASKVRRGYKRSFNSISESAFDQVGRMIHQQFSPERFKERHAREVGYTPRQPGYMQQKLRKIGRVGRTRELKRISGITGLEHPLRFSGKSKADAKYAAIRATSKRVELTYRYLNVFNFRSQGQRVNMREEFQRMTAREVKKIERRYNYWVRTWLEQADLNNIFKTK